MDREAVELLTLTGCGRKSSLLRQPEAGDKVVVRLAINPNYQDRFFDQDVVSCVF